MSLYNMLRAYVPWNEQEAEERRIMLSALERLESPLTRENPFAHFTASGWIINGSGTHVLMAWHNIYQSWSWTGGHADGEENLLAVALREAREETGIERIEPVLQDIYSLEILPVRAHVKRGKYIAPHLHLNVTYLLAADDGQTIHCKPDENSAVGWLSLGQSETDPDEDFMRDVYRKLNEKLKTVNRP